MLYMPVVIKIERDAYNRNQANNRKKLNIVILPPIVHCVNLLKHLV